MNDYIAYVSVSEQDRRAIEAATPLGLAAVHFLENDSPGFVPDDEPIELAFTGVKGDHVPAAVEHAERTYGQIRARANLPPHSPRRITVAPASGLSSDPRHFALLESAQQLFQRGQLEFAVVAAQTACEVYVELAITELLRARQLGPFEDVIPQLLNGYSLMDSRGRKVFAAVTGREVQQAAFWPHYKAHVERRNHIVHRGARATQKDAGESLAAAASLFVYAADAWNTSA